MLQLFILYLSLINVSKAELQIVTTDFSPYQIQVGDQVEGITTDIVKAVVKNAGETVIIRMYPWPRAYKIAQREPNLIIYSINRTPEREKMFKWIGVIAPYDVYFWKMQVRSDIKVATMEDAKNYMTGGVFEDVKADYLMKEGFSERKKS